MKKGFIVPESYWVPILASLLTCRETPVTLPCSVPQLPYLPPLRLKLLGLCLICHASLLYCITCNCVCPPSLNDSCRKVDKVVCLVHRCPPPTPVSGCLCNVDVFELCVSYINMGTT